MGKIVLIGCGKRKLDKPAAAKDLYQGDLFKKSWAYAQKIGYDKIFILSAEHRLLDPEKKIEPYNETLNGKSEAEKKKWAKEVLEKMEAKGLSLTDDEFVILAGKNYYKYLVGEGGIRNYNAVFSQHKGFGYILKFLKDESSI